MIEQVFISDEHSDIIVDQDWLRFALVEGDNKQERAERARRIAACVNACAGLSTDDLEKTGLVSAVGYQLIELEKERDALKALNSELVEALKTFLFDFGDFDTNEERIAEFRRARQGARTVVAKAEEL